MASVAKIVDKMKRQPSGISVDEADKVLNHYGYEFKRQTGSHRQYRNSNGEKMSIPKRKPTILSCYVYEIISKLGL